MFQGCFAASGTECLESVQNMIKSHDYQGILGQKVLPSVRKQVMEYFELALYEPRSESYLIQRLSNQLTSA